jgi:hypothetical protein
VKGKILSVNTSASLRNNQEPLFSPLDRHNKMADVARNEVFKEFEIGEVLKTIAKDDSKLFQIYSLKDSILKRRLNLNNALFLYKTKYFRES